jgi:hypothetical protein
MTDQPAFSSATFASDPLESTVNCVQSVTHDSNCNGFVGSFDPSTTDQVNFSDISDLMKLIEDQDNSCFAETGASQSDLNLSLDYLLNCKSAETGLSQAGPMQFVPMPNISLSTGLQLSVSSNESRHNDMGRSGASLQHLPSGNIIIY